MSASNHCLSKMEYPLCSSRVFALLRQANKHADSDKDALRAKARVGCQKKNNTFSPNLTNDNINNHQVPNFCLHQTGRPVQMKNVARQVKMFLFIKFSFRISRTAMTRNSKQVATGRFIPSVIELSISLHRVFFTHIYLSSHSAPSIKRHVITMMCVRVTV